MVPLSPTPKQQETRPYYRFYVVKVWPEGSLRFYHCFDDAYDAVIEHVEEQKWKGDLWMRELVRDDICEFARYALNHVVATKITEHDENCITISRINIPATTKEEGQEAIRQRLSKDRNHYQNGPSWPLGPIQTPYSWG